MGKEIIINVPLDSTKPLEVKMSGYKGASCLEASKFLEKLGEKTGDRKTPEFYEKATERQREKQQ